MQLSLTEYLLVMLGMGAVTYLPRWLPLFLLSRRTMPQWFIDWLQFVPVSILSAILIPILFLDTEGMIRYDRPDLWVGILTALVARFSRSLGGTVFAGMLLFWIADTLF